MKLTAVYRGKNKYGGEKFSVSKSDDKVMFQKLFNVRNKIDNKEFGTFNPVYINEVADIACITCKTTLVPMLLKNFGSTFDISITVYEKTYKGKTFVNFRLKKSKLVKLADRGTETNEYD